MNARFKVAKAVSEVEDLPIPASGSSSLSRKIPKGYVFQPKALKPLVRSLFSTSIALGHALSAYREFARVKSSSVSPDGNLGGQGYVMSVVEVRETLQRACEMLSKVTDTLHDEANGPHWKPAIADLSSNESEDIEEMLEETDQVLDNPESVGQSSVQEVESRNDKQAASQLPGGGGTPRVNRKGPAAAPTTDGSWNETEPKPEDVFGLKHASPVVWGASELPIDDNPPSDMFDFGAGYGARGRGLNQPPSASSKLPDGSDLPVTRSDYYQEGHALKMWSSSQLPTEPKNVSKLDLGLLDTSDTEEDMAQPFNPYGRNGGRR